MNSHCLRLRILYLVGLVIVIETLGCERPGVARDPSATKQSLDSTLANLRSANQESRAKGALSLKQLAAGPLTSKDRQAMLVAATETWPADDKIDVSDVLTKAVLPDEMKSWGYVVENFPRFSK